MIRIFLLDDQELVRRGVRDLLRSTEDITVVGEAGSSAEALQEVERTQPDVAILDVRLGEDETTGIEVCRELRSTYPDVACVMLTSYPDEDALMSSILAGASGYVLKHIKGPELVDAIRRVAAGESLLEPSLTEKALNRLRGPAAPSDPLANLTVQERKVLELIADGMTNRQIGQQLFLAEKTVKNYVSSLLGKMGMRRRSEAAAYAARLAERRRIQGPA